MFTGQDVGLIPRICRALFERAGMYTPRLTCISFLLEGVMHKMNTQPNTFTPWSPLQLKPAKHTTCGTLWR